MSKYFEERDRKRELTVTIYVLISCLCCTIIPYNLITDDIDKGLSLADALRNYIPLDIFRSIFGLLVIVLISDEMDTKEEQVSVSGVFNAILLGTLLITPTLLLLAITVGIVGYALENFYINKKNY